MLQYAYDPARYGWDTFKDEAELDKAALDIIRQMTLNEKIAIMGEQDQLSRLKVGLGIIIKKNVPFKASGNERLKVPPILFTDGPRGVTFCGGRSTTFPVALARGASWNKDLERRIGEVIGREARAVQSNYSGAVCLNVLRHPGWGRAQETYGEDPWHLGEMASASIEGIQVHNVLACPKHFAANSIENSRYVVSANMDERTLREVYLPHFKKCVDRGALTIMSAYNRLNGEYCGHNRYLLTDILRGEWGFKGYVTSDWDNGIYDTEKPIKAGMNVEMSFAVHYTRKKVKRLLRDEKISEDDIDRLIYPVIRTQIYWVSRKDRQSYPLSLLQAPEHVALAREAAEESIILLKNDGPTLPFRKEMIRKIAIVGSLAMNKNTGDQGSSWTRISPEQVVSPFEGIWDHLSGQAAEISLCTESDPDALQHACQGADVVVICVGRKPNEEGEFISMKPQQMKDRDPNSDNGNWVAAIGLLGQGGDRESLDLDEADIRTIKTVAKLHKNIVVCLIGGSAITVEGWLNEVPAILHTFYGGMEGGKALARILFGDVNPSSKLPFTVPVSAADLPPFDPYCREAEYGYYHGYTLLDKKGIVPRFAFGFGMSYTSFRISDLQVEQPVITPGKDISVSVKVTNTGAIAGAEVVQVYIGFPHSKVDRPIKLLRGFEKVFLEPGETKTLSFYISPDDLAYYDTESKRYVIENMEYELYTGNTSEMDKLLKAAFTLSGY